MLSQCLRSCQVRTSIAEVDLALQKLDHVAVQVDIPIEFSCCVNRRRTFDFHAPTPVCDGPPSDIEWRVNVHTHAATLQRWLQNTQPPRTKAVRRKSHLTDDTWSMVRWKRHHFLRARTVQRLQNRYCLLAVFHAWKATAPVSDCSSWMRLCEHTIALHLWQYQRLSRCVTKAVRLDDKNFYVHLAAQKG